MTQRGKQPIIEHGRSILPMKHARMRCNDHSVKSQRNIVPRDPFDPVLAELAVHSQRWSWPSEEQVTLGMGPNDSSV